MVRLALSLFAAVWLTATTAAQPATTRATTPAPADLTLLRAKDIQTELKLSDEQVALVTAEFRKWSDRLRETRPAPTALERDTQTDAVRAEIEKTLAAALKLEQAARLRQLKLQQLHGTSPRDTYYRTDAVARSLALAEPQIKQLDAVAAGWEAEVVRAFETDQPFPATKTAVDAATAARTAKADAVLTPEQAAKAKELVGAKYAGSYTIRPTAFGGPAGIGGDRSPDRTGPALPSITSSARVFREASFGTYSQELSHVARNPDVQAELKMTPEQVKKAQAASTALLEQFRLNGTSGNLDATAKSLPARAAHTEKAVADILTADQRARLRQVMIQILESPTSTSPLLVHSAAAYPGVAEAIKLTPEQKAKLVDGTKPAEVLTDGQKRAVAEMAGEPYKGSTVTPSARSTTPPARGAPARSSVAGEPAGGTGRGGFSRNPAIPARVQLLAGDTLDADLKLTPEQKAKVAAAVGEYRKGHAQAVDDFRAGSAAMTKARTALVEKFEADLAAAIGPDRLKRFDQLALQSATAARLSAAFAEPAVSRKLGLSEEQTRAVAAHNTDGANTLRLLATVGLPAARQTELTAKVRGRTDGHILAVLTDPQRRAWKELTGEPADLRKPTAAAP